MKNYIKQKSWIIFIAFIWLATMVLASVHAAEQTPDVRSVAIASNTSTQILDKQLQPEGFTEGLPTVTVIASDAEASEAGLDPGVLTFSRTGDTATNLTLRYTISGTATAGPDYQKKSGIVRIKSGQSIRTITIKPKEDKKVEGAESVIATLSPNTAYKIGASGDAAVIISDNDAGSGNLPRLSVVASDPFASEIGPNPGALTFTRTGDTGSLLTLFYTLSGTASNKHDYERKSGVVRILPGKASHTIFIKPIPDSNVEGDESVIATIDVNESYEVSVSNKATVIISNAPANSGDRPMISLYSYGNSAVESPFGGFILRVYRPDKFSDKELTVRYTVSGTATAGKDYTSLSGSITMKPGVVMESFPLSVVDDKVQESRETIIVTLSENAAYEIQGSGKKVLFIIDNDPLPKVTVEATDASASEVGLDPGQFTFTRTGDTDSSLKVYYRRGGTADYPVDYRLTSENVIIPPDQESLSISVKPVNDAIVEGDETVVLSIVKHPYYVVGNRARRAKVTLHDSGSGSGNVLPVVTVTASDAAEAGIPGEVTFSRTGDISKTLAIEYELSGTATEVADYLSKHGILRIFPGHSSRTILIEPVDDQIFEIDETVIITVVPRRLKTYQTNAQSLATMTIADNDPLSSRPVATVEVTNRVLHASSFLEAAKFGNLEFVFNITGDGSSGWHYINYSLSGTATLNSDYSVMKDRFNQTGTIRISGGQKAYLQIRVINDDEVENDETVTLTLLDTGAYGLGASKVVSATILDDDKLRLQATGTYATGTFGKEAAGIVDHDAASQRIFVTNADTHGIDAIDISDPANPVLDGTFDVSPYGNKANSVAVHNGLVVVAVEASPKQDPGRVVFFDAATLTHINNLQLGSLPKMVTFTPDGNFILVANEGEPADDYSVDPEGSISIIDLRTIAPADLTQVDVVSADFTAFNNQPLDPSVRIFGPGATAAEDFEPEYITVFGSGPDNWEALVTLQENNAVAVVKVDAARVDRVLGLGFQNHNTYSGNIDASDKDGRINIYRWPVLGMYQPDSIASFVRGGQTYFVTANQGASRDYSAFSEVQRVKDLFLDASTFPKAASLQLDENLGRLKITNSFGDIDGDGDFDALYSYGTRSFSIWSLESGSEKGQLTLNRDSGRSFMETIASKLPENFNSSEDDNDSFDTRSDDKGSEPEGIVTGDVSGRTLVFIGLEAVGGIMVYEISPFGWPNLLQYINTRDFSEVAGPGAGGDMSPEGMVFIKASDSPNGKPLLVVSYKVSGSTTIYQIGN